MHFSNIWKMVSGLPTAHIALIVLLVAGSIAGACIALWNVVPLAFEYSRERWRRHMRRRARRRWHGVTRTPAAPVAIEERIHDRARSHRRLSLKAWLAVVGCSAVSILGGIAVGYLLNRQPDHSSLSARLTEGRDAVRLRIDHDLRKR
jgi:hypothetical protein